jgi:hypothetical protein
METTHDDNIGNAQGISRGDGLPFGRRGAGVVGEPIVMG